MLFFASLQIITIVVLLLGFKDTFGLPNNTVTCAARCKYKLLTQVYKQSVNGTCVQKCIFRKRFARKDGYVPQGYICGSCPGRDPSRYNIDIEGYEIASAAVRRMLPVAAKRWEQVITGDLPEWNTFYIWQDSACFPYVPKVIDDLFICASAIHIDGVHNILGRAGAEYVRFDGVKHVLPLIGTMQFDKDDLKDLLRGGDLEKVILHEMGHVLGIGTRWKVNDLVSNCSYSAETKASAEWRAFSGCTSVIPVETDGGDEGIACSHWDEACLQGELMTGTVSGDGMEISRMTVGTLEDVGYTVDYSGADEFLPSQANSSCLCTTANRRLNAVPTNKQYLPKDRKLSEARENAIAYGKKHLEENAARAEMAGVEGSQIGISYVAHKEVFILYRENDGSVQSVAVTAKV